ncbi:MAG TPA: hypothetical protein VHO24_06310 [Opitutaceae bacterium]|nr:hypothetical protein [Opitutaceae bacterium]
MIAPSRLLFGTALLAFAGRGIFVAGVGLAPTGELDAVRQRCDLVTAELQQLRGQNDRTVLRVRSTQDEIASLEASPAAIELDAEVAAWLGRVVRLRKLAAERPECTLPEFELLNEQDWFGTARDAKFDTEEDLLAALQDLRTKARLRLGPRLREALVRFLDAHDGQLPGEVSQLAPFMTPPVSAAILERYEMLHHGNIADLPRNDWLLLEKTSFDEAHDNRFFLSRFARGTTVFTEVRQPDLRQALQTFLAANDGRFPSSPAQLLPFFPRPPSPLALKTFLEQPADDFTADKLQGLLPED